MSAAFRYLTGVISSIRTDTVINASFGGEFDINDGDELLLFFVLISPDPLPTPTFPSGFEIIGGPVTVVDSFIPTTARSWLLRKRANGESGPYTITHDSCTADALLVYVKSGSETSSQVTTNNGSGIGATITFTGITTTTPGAWLGAFCHNWNQWVSETATPNGSTPTYQERWATGSSYIYFAEGTWESSGDTGSPTKPSDNTGGIDPQWVAMLVGIEPAPTMSSFNTREETVFR